MQNICTHNLDKQHTDVIRPDGATLTVGYVGGGRLGTVTPSAGAGNTVTYGYSATTGQLTSLVNSSVTLGYTYDGALPTQETFAGTVTGSLTRTYDADFREIGLALGGTNIATVKNAMENAAAISAQICIPFGPQHPP